MELKLAPGWTGVMFQNSITAKFICNIDRLYGPSGAAEQAIQSFFLWRSALYGPVRVPLRGVCLRKSLTKLSWAKC